MVGVTPSPGPRQPAAAPLWGILREDAESVTKSLLATFPHKSSADDCVAELRQHRLPHVSYAVVELADRRRRPRD